MSIAYDSKIVVSRYEHLKGRLVCYIWLRQYQTANDYTNKEDKGLELLIETFWKRRPKGGRAMKTKT